MSLIKLNIKGISYSQTQSGAYALVLNEIMGERTLPIIIGAFEAQSIAIALEKEIRTPRPLTHDLFKTFSDKFSIKIIRVIIHKLVDGVFYSSLICEREGVEKVIDARTSDAIALAVRFQAPIFTYENILDKAGVFLKIDEELMVEEDSETDEIEFSLQEDFDTEQKYAHITLDELNIKLNEAVANEDYELAAEIRDEISKRS